MSRAVLAIDQGTTGNTVILISEEGEILGRVTREFPQIYPQPGWVEHDPEVIFQGVRGVIEELLSQTRFPPQKISAIGITNQRETIVLWERQTLKPVAKAIVWQCRRTEDRCRKLREEGREEWIFSKTGLLLDPYFSATKIEWLLDRVDPQRKRANQFSCGTMDSYLLARLTGGRIHATDATNASRTMLMDLRTTSWDPQLLSLFRIPSEILPEIRPSDAFFGETSGLDFLPDGIPIHGILGDQQAALFGQQCFTPGSAKCTYGTGAFLLVHTGSAPVFSRYRLLTTVAFSTKSQGVEYALEGSVFIAGAAVQWLRDGLKIIKKASEVEELARRVPDSGGVVFVPALVGLGAPYWRSDARGVIAGITRGTTAEHIARATLEGIAMSVADLVEAMNADLKEPISEIGVDGGAASNNLLMELQADFAGVTLRRPKMLETTAFGAGLLAGLGIKLWSGREDLSRLLPVERRFTPQLSPELKERKREEWKRIVAKA